MYAPVVILGCISDIGQGTPICMLLGREREASVRWGSRSCHQRCQTVGPASGQHRSSHTPALSVLRYTLCATIDSCDLVVFLLLGGRHEYD